MPLFMPRLTKLVAVRWEERHKLQKQLYESVTEYVRLGYNQAIRQNRQYLGFLMILMQRLVTSSTRAIATAMERRLEVLNATNVAETDEEPPENDLSEQDGQEQLESLLAIRLAGLQEREGRGGAAPRSRPALSGPGAGRPSRDAARHPVRQPAGREQPGVEVPDLHRVRPDAEHAPGVPGSSTASRSSASTVRWTWTSGDESSRVRREDPHPGLDRRRW